MKTINPDKNQLHELLANRWSPRAFSYEMLSETEVANLFEAARWAASANNEQPWRFIYSTDRNSETYRRLFECLVPFNQDWAKTAPLLMLTLVRTNFTKNNKFNRYAQHDLGLAIGNMTVQAASAGIYVHNMGGFEIEKAKELFGISPDFEPVTMIAAGRLGDINQIPSDLQETEFTMQKRKGINEIATTDFNFDLI
ncbi:MAG TPA: nitroreductase [Bacteroidales bacterium]|nr:nitroreductase [Bacteroidales bacterium]